MASRQANTGEGAAREASLPAVLLDSLKRLSPISLKSNPVMLVVELTFFIVAAMAVSPKGFPGVATVGSTVFYVEVAAILLITVWFSTLSDSLAERQVRNTANSLRKLESETTATKVVQDDTGRKYVSVPSSQLRKGDIISVEKDQVVPIDADVLEGVAMVDESLLTGESAPVRKGVGDQLIGGSKLLSDSLVGRVTVNPEDTYISRMIRMVESSKRPKTPNEEAIEILLIGLTLIFTIIVAAILGLSIVLGLGVDLSVLIALYVCLLPTTIGALLPAIGLSGISRLYSDKIIAKSGKSVETAGDADTVLLDKTGTITVGNRQAVEFRPLSGHTEREVGEEAFLASWNDDTPEGRSIVELAHAKGFVPKEFNALAQSTNYEFSASTRTSGVRMADTSAFALPKGNEVAPQHERRRRKFEKETSAYGSAEIIKGAPDSMLSLAQAIPADYRPVVDEVSKEGDTAIAIAKNGEVTGIIRLRDVIKPGIEEKVRAMKAMEIKPVMITGDNPLTAASISKEVGIDHYVSQAKPDDKYRVVLEERAQSRIVAMIGDGTNDAPALAIADVGLAMNSGTQAAKEAANMVDLESNPAKVIDVVMLGKQLLMTRGAVTAFSIANDVAKYFAIVPVMFATIPALQALNILHLGLHTAILSALIFNAVIIPLLIPLSMRGVEFKPRSTMSIFLRNTMVYGVGGVIVPFVGIKLIDVLLVYLGGHP